MELTVALAAIRKALDPYYSEMAPGGTEDAATDILNALLAIEPSAPMPEPWVWVVVDRIDYHGSEPVRVFTDEGDADTFVATRNARHEATDYAEVIKVPADERTTMNDLDYFDIVFARREDSPDLTFVEVEDPDGKSFQLGDWVTEGGYERMRVRTTEIDARHAMLLIKSIAPEAHLELSEHTGKWWVSSRIEVGGNGILVGFNEQRDDPSAAVLALLAELRTVASDRYLVTGAHTEQRRHWRWNGAAFREVPRTDG